jgi:hypothetical protein
MLTTHVLAYSFDGPDLYNNREAFHFRVDGLPASEEAQIRKSYYRWQTRRLTNKVWSDWSGEFASAEEALASFAKN